MLLPISEMLLVYIFATAFLTVLTISKPTEFRSLINFKPSNLIDLGNFKNPPQDTKFSALLEKEKNVFAENSKNHFRAYKDYKHVELPPIQQNYNNKFAFNLTNDGSGKYYTSVETYEYDRAEQGFLKNVGTDDEVQVVKGQYQERYTDKLGIERTRIIGYIADENGYQPFVVNETVNTTPPPAIGSSIFAGSVGFR